MTIWKFLDEKHLELRLVRRPSFAGAPGFWECGIFDPMNDNSPLGLFAGSDKTSILFPTGNGVTAEEAITNIVDLIKGKMLAIRYEDEDEIIEPVPVPSDLTA